MERPPKFEPQPDDLIIENLVIEGLRVSIRAHRQDQRGIDPSLALDWHRRWFNKDLPNETT